MFGTDLTVSQQNLCLLHLDLATYHSISKSVMSRTMASSQIFWCPEKVLQLNEYLKRCAGQAVSGNVQCTHEISQDSLLEAYRLLAKIARMDPRVMDLNAWLEELALKLICRKIRKDREQKIVNVMRKWKVLVEAFLDSSQNRRPTGTSNSPQYNESSTVTITDVRRAERSHGNSSAAVSPALSPSGDLLSGRDTSAGIIRTAAMREPALSPTSRAGSATPEASLPSSPRLHLNYRTIAALQPTEHLQPAEGSPPTPSNVFLGPDVQNLLRRQTRGDNLPTTPNPTTPARTTQSSFNYPRSNFTLAIPSSPAMTNTILHNDHPRAGNAPTIRAPQAPERAPLTNPPSPTQQAQIGECPICSDDLGNGTVLAPLVFCESQCQQVYHLECLEEWFQRDTRRSCPYWYDNLGMISWVRVLLTVL